MTYEEEGLRFHNGRRDDRFWASDLPALLRALPGGRRLTEEELHQAGVSLVDAALRATSSDEEAKAVSNYVLQMVGIKERVLPDPTDPEAVSRFLNEEMHP